MADSREIGMRVGAATNQAAQVASALIGIGVIDGGNTAVVAAKVNELAGQFLGIMEGYQQALSGAPAVAPAPAAVQAAVTAAFPGTTVQTAPAAAAESAAPSGYNTQFSGATKPLKLAEHPELDAWLHAQAAAVGVDSVWDNRGKPNYIAAVNEGKTKTPPPFRSATEGVEKSFWPPS